MRNAGIALQISFAQMANDCVSDGRELFVFFACGGGGQVSTTTKAVKCVREEEVTSFIGESPSVVRSLYWVSNK